MAHSRGVRILDFSTPNSPSTVMDWDPVLNIRRVAIDGDLMAAASGSNGYLVDISNPGSPSIVGNLIEPNTIEDIDIEGSMLYVADGVTGMVLRDITTPATPNGVGVFHPQFSNALGVKAFGTTVYMSSDTLYGMFRVDASTPSLPVEDDLFETPGSARKIIGNDDYLILSDYDSGVYVWGKTVVVGPVIFEDSFESF